MLLLKIYFSLFDTKGGYFGCISPPSINLLYCDPAHKLYDTVKSLFSSFPPLFEDTIEPAFIEAELLS